MGREKAREDRQDTLQIGALLQSRGDLDDAERIFRLHLRDDPDDADVEIELGSCLLDAGRLDEALELFERVLSAAPDHVRGRLCKALALDRAGRHGSTAGIEDRLGHSEDCRTRAPRPFLAVVQAHAADPPARWPEGATGFLVRLHVVARDEGEAMAVALDHLRRGEPDVVRFQLDLMPAPGRPITSVAPQGCEAGERVWIRVIREVPVVAASTAPADPPRDQRLRHQSEARRRTHIPARRRSPR
ncbi:MAG: tetratricopeptide repeat protein [Nannocystis sp.]|nr:tetratricopeptide repeat protein [Nannocystis sp.]MBA3546903.1 tetratricopeptide repeat protein [Nannocystis sp.]